MKEKHKFYFHSLVDLYRDDDFFPTGNKLSIYWNQDFHFINNILREFTFLGLIKSNRATYNITEEGWIAYGSISSNEETDRFRRHIKQTELSDLDIGELLGVPEMQIRRWKHIGPPVHVNKFLSIVGFMMMKKKSFTDIKKMISFQDSWIMSY